METGLFRNKIHISFGMQNERRYDFNCSCFLLDSPDAGVEKGRKRDAVGNSAWMKLKVGIVQTKLRWISVCCGVSQTGFGGGVNAY